MKRSNFAFKIKYEDPGEEESLNAKLLIRAGFIHKEMAGVYALLPLGLRVVENIKSVIRQEMNAIGGQELLMTSLQPSELWAKTNRWDSEQVDIWFKTMLASGTEVGLAWSHEEPIGDLLTEHIASYRDLPIYLYQFQTKLRNELRAKSGILRGREFIMKDLYSFSLDEATHQEFYERATQAYLKIFDRLGIGDRTYLTLASGGAFTKFSHEFQTLLDSGEDTIYLSRAKKLAVNKEILEDSVLTEAGLTRNELEEVRASEVGNIFSFGDKKSIDLGLYYTSAEGEKKPVILGSYGIGITRMLGVLAEVFADDKGLVWPKQVAPYQVYLIGLGDEATETTEKLYAGFEEAGLSTIIDDRDERAGAKFSDCDLLGIPYRIVVSAKTLESGSVELKMRTEEKVELVPVAEVIAKLKQ